MMVTDFLDITLNLENGSFRPYRKDNKPPTYIHKDSNHPPHIKKELPKMISKRISQLSSSKEVFEAEAPVYNAALNNSGYTEGLQYNDVRAQHSRRTRKRKITWFNPPWNDAVATNVASKFLQLLDKYFPKNSPLHKIFNRNTVKVSYSCMPNMASTISSHNKFVLGMNPAPAEGGCNCRSGADQCALNGRCLTSSLVYKCIVSTEKEHKEYIGLTANTFKQRYTAHKASFKHQNQAHHTALSNYIWNLKSNDTPFSASWSIMKQASTYSKETMNCQLCLTEKTLISLADRSTSLNKRSEIMGKCRHRDKWLLKHR